MQTRCISRPTTFLWKPPYKTHTFISLTTAPCKQIFTQYSLKELCQTRSSECFSHYQCPKSCSGYICVLVRVFQREDLKNEFPKYVKGMYGKKPVVKIAQQRLSTNEKSKTLGDVQATTGLEVSADLPHMPEFQISRR